MACGIFGPLDSSFNVDDKQTLHIIGKHLAKFSIYRPRRIRVYKKFKISRDGA